MIAVQYATLVLVAVAGTLVVLARDPGRQAVVTGVFGLALSILFFAFQAPDVALSALAVGTVAMPGMILLALAMIAREDEDG